MEGPEIEARRRAAMERIERRRGGEATAPEPAPDTLVESLEYDVSGDEPTVIYPDETRRPATPEELREIARQRAGEARTPGMPDFRLRTLDAEGRPAGGATPAAEPRPPEPPPAPRPPEPTPQPADVIPTSPQTPPPVPPAPPPGPPPGPAAESPREGRTNREEAMRWAGIAPTFPGEPPHPTAGEPPSDIGQRPGLGRLVSNRIPEGERGPDWRNLDGRRYAGLTIKPIQDMLANERDAQFFGEVLRAINPDFAAGVLDRYNNGTASREDMDFMTYGAHEYALRLKFAEEASGLMNKNIVELLSRRNKDVLNLITHVGEDRATGMVKKAIFHMSMKDPDAVGQMKDMLVQLTRDRDTHRYKETERRVNALCMRVGIKPKDYDSVFDLSSRTSRRESREYLTKRFHESAGKFRRAIDWLQTNPNVSTKFTIALPGSSRFAANRAMRMADFNNTDHTYHMPLSNATRRIEESLEGIARFIGPTVSDPDMRQLIVQEALTNESQTPVVERGPKTFKQMQQLHRERFSQASIETRIREHIADDPRWESRSPSEQDSILRNMARTEKREQAGGSFWAWLFSILLDKSWDKATTNVIGRPIHA